MSLEIISFLQGKYLLLPGNQEKAYLSQFPGHNKFFGANSTSDSVFTKTPSPPVLKNAISLATTGGSQAFMLPLLSPVTFNSKQESFGPAKQPRLSCEPIMEGKAQEKRITSWSSSGSASQPSQDRDSHSSSLSEQYPAWTAKDMFDHPTPRGTLIKGKTKSEQSLSDLTGSLLSLQLDLRPSLLDEVLNVTDKNK
ncbi:hypothetical protein P7K49_033911 [Saguinus oedipus]|uniref:Cdc42 effector-like domain-containing protein n=1 Tax=Saguinus oedipus TaxID=9490 RepID=A0ABQ9TT93_SAGOE|nr:hypothetical protein P7K49_033911 [Saguinus oedipus]